MRSISINAFDTSSIDNAISWLGTYKKYIELGANMVTDECADAGCEIAQQYLDEGAADAAGNGEFDITDLDMWVEKRDDMSASYHAPGDTVWIEFGTGVSNNPSGYGSFPHDTASFVSSDRPSAASLGMDAIGKWSNRDMSKFHDHSQGFYNSWVYNSATTGRPEVTFGIPCNPFMVRSVAELIPRIGEIVKRAFRLK